MNKIEELNKLRKEIISELYIENWRDVWFFPRYTDIKGAEKVKGYLGTDPIVFLSINPSYGSYSSPAIIFYYNNLQRQGFANAHLTDLFKFKIKDSHELSKVLADKNEVLRATKLLGEELQIIKPKLIVGVGKSYKKLYEQAVGDKYPLVLITHYSYATRWNERQQFKSAMRDLKVKYGKL